jgi:hypothetical protein
MAVVFVTYAMQFFRSTAVIPALLRLTPLVWRAGFLWQLLTYPLIGWGPASILFLIELLMLYWFGGDVYRGMGRRHFWKLIGWCALVGGVVAVAADALAWAAAGKDALLLEPFPYPIIQGQQLLIAIFICAFATANRQAQILLFFVLPIQARWFIAIEIAIAFIVFLQTHDFPGFLGLCAAIGIAYLYVRDGGIGRGLRQTRLRVERWWLQRKHETARRKRGFRVIPGERPGDRGSRESGGRGPWLH